MSDPIKVKTTENNPESNPESNSEATKESTSNFKTLGLAKEILPALNDLGYEAPSPIQEQSIPILLEGRDIIAQAQTGTGKTAAFALPVLSRLELDIHHPQALILAPTRELAIQVAEAFQVFAKYMKGFHILPIYGGQDYRVQLKGLKRGVHVVVGTPGRVMDHMRRGTLILDEIKTLVLDEADEMLKMGFIDDIQWILEQMPAEHQTALFSATIPEEIKRVAKKYLNDPAKIHIAPQSKTVPTIEQNYMLVTPKNKIEALTRYLEVEEADGVIIFTKTKIATAELSDKLSARGFSAEAMNGDMKQSLREKVISRLKKGTLDIVVATEVAARGLDVERISHVINYDIPYDAETYIHRIGRTGRAGRKGKSLLLVTPNERRAFNAIERGLNAPIAALEAPSIKLIAEKRATEFSEKVLKRLEQNDLEEHRILIEKIMHQSECSEMDIAAALAGMLYKKSAPRETLGAVEFSADSGRGKKGSGRGRNSGRSSGGSSGRNAGRGSDRSSGRSSRFSDKPSRKPRDAGSKGSGFSSFGPKDRKDSDGGKPRKRSDSRDSSDYSRSDKPKKRYDSKDKSDFGKSDRPRSDRPRSDSPRSDRPRSDNSRSDSPRKRSDSKSSDKFGKSDNYKSDKPRKRSDEKGPRKFAKKSDQKFDKQSDSKPRARTDKSSDRKDSRKSDPYSSMKKKSGAAGRKPKRD